ncbi:DUF4761 family protein [Escherichia coli]|nr:hypothetical protein CSC15_0012 [Escherichia coli]
MPAQPITGNRIFALSNGDNQFGQDFTYTKHFARLIVCFTGKVFKQADL